MKATKKIIGASCALVAALALSAGSTFAWFASNSKVSAEGMKLTAKAPSYLVISSEDSISASSVDSSVSFSTQTNSSVSPITYSNGWKVDNGSVDATLGTTTDELKDAGNVEDSSTSSTYVGGNYFIDFTIYVASTGESFLLDYFTATVSATVSSDADVEYAPAASIAFYYDEVKADNLLGTANANAKTDSTKAVAESYVYTGAATKLNQIDSSNGITIKKADGSSGALKLILRVYFDGAMSYSEQKTGDSSAQTYTYVRSAALTTNTVSVSVSLEATAKAAS
jgi:hypothetical protein